MLFTLIWHGKGQDQQPLAERVIGKQFVYTVARGDSLTSIGARFGVDAGGSGESSKFVKTGSLKRLPTPSRLIVFRRNDQNRT
jgi:hypothetical protein